MRLDKFLGNMGVGSRKDVKILIKKGKVTVNNKKIRSSNLKVNSEIDKITVHDEVIQFRKHIYLMLNKPVGFISATEDRYEKTVIDLLEPEMKHFEPFPVGRLDKDTEGLLLLTNDGQLAHELASPSNEIDKTYYALIEGKITEDDIKAFEAGVILKDDYKTKPAHLKIIKSDDTSEIELTITEGKYHQVKRMFASQGKHVKFLKRIRMGALVLDESLSKGSYRELTQDELYYCSQLLEK